MITRTETHKRIAPAWRAMIQSARRCCVLGGAVMGPRRYELSDFEWSII